jgi:hypothetical protein
MRLQIDTPAGDRQEFVLHEIQVARGRVPATSVDG